MTPHAGDERDVSISLYDFNIHQMRDKWRGWIQHIKDERLAEPDIVLLQDVAGDRDRQVFEDALTEAFGGRWAGRGSDPAWQTAVVWRGTRFWRAEARPWRGFGAKTCVPDSQDAPAIQVKLFDSKANKHVSVVSLKTPPEVDDDCAWKNFERVHESFRGQWDADLCVVGTDSNSPDLDAGGKWGSWFPKLVRSDKMQLVVETSLGFCDPIVESCEGDKKKLADHATLRTERVDFLLVRLAGRKQPKVECALTLPRGQPEKFSDHRSVHVQLRY